MITKEPRIDWESETMTVHALGMRDLVINLDADSGIHQDRNEAIKVCGNKCGGRLWGDYEVAEWFSSYLGVQCWLARFQKDKRDPHPQHQESTSATSVPRVGFANEQAILLISENAVGLLNDVLVKQNQRPVCSRHFRPNMVVRAIDSENGHIEDEWNVLAFRKNGLSFETKGSCARCAMVDFDPYSGKKGKTLRALANVSTEQRADYIWCLPSSHDWMRMRPRRQLD